VDWSEFVPRYVSTGDLPKFVKDLTDYSICVGLVPRKCPVCGTSALVLVAHHWKGPHGNAIQLGEYRRVCLSCNKQLGVIFGTVYPSWRAQLKGLRSYYEELRVTLPQEGWWSRITVGELVTFLKSENKCKELSPQERFLVRLGLRG